MALPVDAEVPTFGAHSAGSGLRPSLARTFKDFTFLISQIGHKVAELLAIHQEITAAHAADDGFGLDDDEL